MQKLLSLFKRMPLTFAGIFLLFCVGSCLFIYFRYVFFHPVFGFIIVAGCILLATLFKDGNWLKWAIIFPVLIVAVFIVDGDGLYKPFIEQYLLKGHLQTTRVFIEESTDSEGNYYAAHYETSRQFKLSSDESGTKLKVVENILNFLALGLIALTYFILNKWRLKLQD